MNLMRYNNHFMYIKDLKQIRHVYRCRKCDKICKNMEACNRHEKYRDLMLKDATQYNLEQKQNKMTDVQRENWIPWKDILGYVDKLKAKYYYIFKEEKPSREDILNLQKYVMLCVYTIIPPRRLQDYTLMKVKNYSKDKDNYYEKGTFYFRTYKTAKFLGMQKEKVPKNLESLLTKWIKWRGSDHLFTDYYGKEFQSAGMTKALNSIFHPKRISVNQLRHIYITEKCGPMLKQLEEVASSMGHSEGQQKLYVKNE